MNCDLRMISLGDQCSKQWVTPFWTCGRSLGSKNFGLYPFSTVKSIRHNEHNLYNIPEKKCFSAFFLSNYLVQIVQSSFGEILPPSEWLSEKSILCLGKGTMPKIFYFMYIKQNDYTKKVLLLLPYGSSEFTGIQFLFYFHQ